MTIVVGVFLVSAFIQGGKQRFSEIDVERINIVEKDGSLRLVISNNQRSPGPIQRGKPFGYPGGTRAGLIFYNEEGTENGGLIFSGKRENGQVSAVGSLTFDQYEQDQTIALQYVDDSGARRAGLTIQDWPADISAMEFAQKWKAMGQLPAGPTKTKERESLQRYRPKIRMYAGRGVDGASLLVLADAEGRIRLKLVVGRLGEAHIEFLDEKGQVTNRYPETAKK
jgi:hypothetical protein